MGGNQVIGLNSSVIAESWGSAIESVFNFDTPGCQAKFTLAMVYTDGAVGKAPQCSGRA